jgi:hypothetical protein
MLIDNCAKRFLVYAWNYYANNPTLIEPLCEVVGINTIILETG